MESLFLEAVSAMPTNVPSGVSESGADLKVC